MVSRTRHLYLCISIIYIHIYQSIYLSIYISIYLSCYLSILETRLRFFLLFSVNRIKIPISGLIRVERACGKEGEGGGSGVRKGVAKEGRKEGREEGGEEEGEGVVEEGVEKVRNNKVYCVRTDISG